MEDRGAEVTVSVVPPETSPKVAVMIVVPAVKPLDKPLLLTVATAVLDELQVTSVVISSLGATGNSPVAVNCWVVPTSMMGLSGVTVMEVGCPIAFPPPHAFKDTAKDPRINIVGIKLKFFKAPFNKKPGHALLAAILRGPATLSKYALTNSFHSPS